MDVADEIVLREIDLEGYYEGYEDYAGAVDGEEGC